MTISRFEPGAGGVIRIVAAVVTNAEGETLLVRKRGTNAFMQPGGKLAEDEPPLTALRREIMEELGVDLVPGSHCFLGRFTAPAANEPDMMVEAQLYSVTLAGEALPQAEIEEAVWLHPSAPIRLPLAPLTERHVMPIALQMAQAEDARKEA